MPSYRNRNAVQMESDTVRVTVLVEGGHIAELFHKPTGVNPLWTPPWPSIEPSTYSLERHPEYGDDSERKLLSGIMGHSLCLDIFGPPTESEAAAGMNTHGEAPVVPYEISVAGGVLTARAAFPEARLRFARTISFASPSRIRITEEVENLSAWDRPIAWTEHVTLGDPFVEPGVTELRTPAITSKVSDIDFGKDKGYMQLGAEFNWPHVPRIGGGTVDMRRYMDRPVSGAFTTHLMDPRRENAYFLAWSPKSKVLIGYVWKQRDFPWLGIWEENHSRTAPPWNGKTVTRAMEFGASPFPEGRRRMIERGSLFGVPGFRWIPARGTAEVEYSAFITTAESIPEEP